jgi:hypothetical protein
MVGTDRLMRPLAFQAIFALLAASFPTAASAQPANQSSYYWNPSLALDDVPADQLVKWLQRAGVNLPFSIDGRVSFSMNGGVPLTALRDAKAYRLDGVVRSPRLRVQNFFLEDFSASVRYRNGVMVLQSVRFRLSKRPHENVSTSFNGRGSIQLAPAGDLAMFASVESLDLARLSDWVGADLQLKGLASGEVDFQVASADFSKPSNFTGRARLRATGLESPGLTVPNADAEFRVANQTLTFDRFNGVVNEVPLGMVGALKLSDDSRSVLLDDLRLDLFGGSLRVNGRAPLGAPTAQDLSFVAENLDLALLDRQLRPIAARLGFDSIPPLQGRMSLAFDGTVPFQNLGDYNLWRLRRTEIRSDRAFVGNVAFEQIDVAATFDGVRFSLNPFRWNWPAAASPDGRPGGIEASVAAQLNLFGRVEIRAQSTHTPVRTLQQLLGVPEILEGHLDGTLSIGAPAFALKTAPTSLSTWVADLQLTGDSLRLSGTPLEFRRLQSRWSSPNFEIRALDFMLAGSPIQASGNARFPPDWSQLLVERAQVTTAFGKGSASGAIALSGDRATQLKLTIENGDAGTLTNLVGEDVFAGHGPLNANLEVVVPPTNEPNRALTVNGALTGVLTGQVQASAPLGTPQGFRSSAGRVDVAVSTPLKVLERNLTDAVVRAEWKDGVVNVSRIGFTLDGVPIGGTGRATIHEDSLALKNVELDLLGGKIRGNATVPRGPKAKGAAEFKAEGIDLALAKPFLPSSTPKTSGAFNASWRMEIDAVPESGGARPIRVTADFAAPLLTYGNWRIARSTGTLRTDKGAAEYSVKGETLDGVFEWIGAHALPQGRRHAEGIALASSGSVSLRNLDLGRLAAAAPRRQLSDDLIRGRLNAKLDYEEPLDGPLNGSGFVEIVNLANRTSELSMRITSSVTFDGRRLRLQDVAGDLLGGRLRGLVVLNLENLRNGAFYRASVEGMSLPKFFPHIGADADLFTGTGDLQVRGRISTAITGAGTIEINRGTFAGLDVSAWRSPAEIEVNLSNYSGRFVIPSSSAQLAQGQMSGKLNYDWDSSGQLESALDFSNVNLKGLLRSSSRIQSIGEGRISGRLQLGGRSIKGLNDLTGSFSGRLQNTQPGSWPIFDRILSMLTGVGGRSLVFDNGSFQGVIGGGATRLNRLELVSQRARIWGAGSIRHNGGLDMDFTAFTGNTSVRGRGGEFLAAQLLTNLNPTTAVLVRINQLLSDRVIAVKVAGTLSSPTVTLKPGPTLTAEAARFLLVGVVPQPEAPKGR